MEGGDHGDHGQHAANHVDQDQEPGPELVTTRLLSMEVSSALGVTQLPQPAIHSVVLLTVFGPPGQPGLHAVRDVVEEPQQELGLAMQWFRVVEEEPALGAAVKTRLAMSNAVLLLEGGAPGDLGASVVQGSLDMIIPVEKDDTGSATTLGHNVEEAAHLDHLMRPLIVATTTAVSFV